MSKSEEFSKMLEDVRLWLLTILLGQNLNPDRVLEAGPKHGERDEDTYAVLQD